MHLRGGIEKRTALVVLAIMDTVECVRLLVEAGSNVDARDAKTWSLR